ncbi:MAG TPA: MarR family transcriptional regulator [Streptosporangiaceae bacterium]|nr:MarR family transcriptional regulator [Streptosporangiaceae bacterium]
MAQSPRWLTRDEQHAWRLFLTASQVLFSAVEGQLQRDSDIPHGYYEILVRLSEADGRALRMNQLAEASTSSKSRLSHAVARLEERGWVKRIDCPTDRRGQVAQLTDAGFAALEAAAPGHAAQVRRSLFDLLTADQVAQLATISTTIVAGAQPEQGDLADGTGCPLAACDEELEELAPGR